MRYEAASSGTAYTGMIMMLSIASSVTFSVWLVPIVTPLGIMVCSCPSISIAIPTVASLTI